MRVYETTASAQGGGGEVLTETAVDEAPASEPLENQLDKRLEQLLAQPTALIVRGEADPGLLIFARGGLADAGEADGFVRLPQTDEKRRSFRLIGFCAFHPLPRLRWILEKIGSVFVRRGESDIEAYKSCLRILKGGEKLLAFPEGTRVHSDTVLPAKTGVIRMAVRTGAPIVPVYLPRDKRLFHHVDIVFGEPYTIEKAAHSDYEPLAQELMDKIWALKDRI